MKTLESYLKRNPEHRCLVCAPTNVGVVNLHERALHMGGYLSLSPRYVPQGSLTCNRGRLCDSQIVFSTVCGRWSPKMSCEGFDAVFVDEAAHCMEAHIWGLLHEISFICLVGDCEQLQAQVSREGKVLNHGRSMMERLLGNGCTGTELTVQRRMHPEICKFPNELFYNSKLETIFDGELVQRPYTILNKKRYREHKRDTFY